MPVTRKATAHTSTRRRSSVRCSTSVMESGWGRASLRRFSEMAMGLVFELIGGSAAGPAGSVHPGVVGHGPARGADLVDDAAGIGDQHPGDAGRLLGGLHRPGRSVGAG